MRLAHLPFVKVCCITSLEEAGLAVGCGASALGLVSAMPSGPGVIDEATIAAIARAVPPPVATFLLTSLQQADAIAAQHLRCGTSVLQLVDHVPQDELRRLRRWLPGTKIVQVLHVADEAALAEAHALAGLVDALLLDSGRPQAAVKELGGTGRTHDWAISRRIRDACGVPVFLAGGLKPDNVAEAIAAVAPFGIDLCSGVRQQGQLHAPTLRQFFAAVAGATASRT
jgi:phosphoribosylanthranilate isomerase